MNTTTSSVPQTSKALFDAKHRMATVLELASREVQLEVMIEIQDLSEQLGGTDEAQLEVIRLVMQKVRMANGR